MSNEMDEQMPSQTLVEETVPPSLSAAPETGAEPDEASIRDMVAQCFAAAEAGDAEMQFAAAKLCQEGLNSQQSDSAAVAWLLKSASQGHVDACRQLVDCYIKGRGVARSISEAITWLEKVAQISDDPNDSLTIGMVYLLGERFEDFANEIVNSDESTDAFLELSFDLSFAEISSEMLEKALPWFEKAAINSSDPNLCLMVAFAHAFGNRVVNVIELFQNVDAADAIADIHSVAASGGHISSYFDDSLAAIGLGSKSKSIKPIMAAMCGLAMFDALASGESSLQSAFDHFFADRFCDYIVRRGSDIGQFPFDVQTVEKWLRLAAVKGNTKLKDMPDWLAFFSSGSSLDAESEIFKSVETDAEEEPYWNMDLDVFFSENGMGSDHDARVDGLTSAVIDRLSAEARKGDELTEQLLSYLYFERILGIRNDESMREAVIARFLPNASNENEAFLKMLQWFERKQDPELGGKYRRVFFMHVLRKIDDSVIFDAWMHQELNGLTDRGRRAFEILRQRGHYRKSAREQAKDAAELAKDTRIHAIMLAGACGKRSHLVGLVLGDEPPRALLGVALLAELKSPSELINLIRPEIEHLEAIVTEAPSRATKGLRYIPATPVMAAVLLALMDGASTPEAARRLAFAHERGDITATYLMSRQTGQSLKTKGHLLRSVLEAIDTLMAKSRTERAMDSITGFPDYLGKIYQLLWRRANDDLNVVKDQEQARAREEERRQMISFLSHTLTSATAGGAKTVSKIASKLASAQANIDLPDVAQHLAAQVSRMARVESLVEVFKLYTSDDKALREGWDRDTGGEFTVLQVCAMAVQQALLRFYFSSEHEADFSRLMPEADYATVAQEFMTDALALDMSTQEQALQFIAWTEQRLPFLRLSFAGAESAHLAQGGARDIVIFALTGEFLGNALKYAAAGQAITLDISVGPQGLEIISRNAMKAVSVAPIHGGKTGLTFIRRVCTLINAEFDEPTVKDNVFILRALLPIQ